MKTKRLRLKTRDFLRQVLLLVGFRRAGCRRVRGGAPSLLGGRGVKRRPSLEFYAKQNGFDGKWSVDKPVTKMGTVRSIDGSQRFDVLELWEICIVRGIACASSTEWLTDTARLSVRRSSKTRNSRPNI